MRQHARKRLLVDAKVQGALVFRVAMYWIACVVTIELLSLSWQIATCPEQPRYVDYFLNQDWRPALVRIIASGLLLVPITFDMLRLSNRFAGPVYRMRRVLRQVAQDGTIEPVRLREKDYWHGFADDLNTALSHLAGEGQASHGSAQEEEPCGAGRG